jgi:hypothetical protein
MAGSSRLKVYGETKLIGSARTPCHEHTTCAATLEVRIGMVQVKVLQESAFVRTVQCV